MDDAQTDGGSESRRQLEELSARVAANRADIDELQARAEQAILRADASDARSEDDRHRLESLEARADVDARMIAELQADGVLSRQHAAHLEVALRSSRRIGAAIGIVMAVRLVDEERAFEILKTASSHANRKLRVIADDVVRTGDVSELPSA